jgi:hypothetical protein
MYCKHTDRSKYADTYGVVSYTKFYQHPLNISENKIRERLAVSLHTQVCVYMLYLGRGGFDFTILWNDNFYALILIKFILYLVVY